MDTRGSFCVGTCGVLLAVALWGPGRAAQAGDAPKPAEGAGAALKWFPGHYLLLGWRAVPSATVKDGDGPNAATPERWSVIADNPHFAGGQRIYLWKHLEPQKGRYDFSRIEKDLAYLKAHNKRLVVEVWDTYFFGKLTAAPDYLLTDPAYKGGIFYRAKPGQKDRGSIVKRYVPAVMDRYIALVCELGRRFDSDPHLAGFANTETSMSNVTGSEDFDARACEEQMKRLVTASGQAFPSTPVFIYGNWYHNQAALKELAEHAYANGLVWGGPDLCPPAQRGWGDQILRAYQGRMAGGLAVQWQSYDGRWTAEQLFDCGVNDLKLSFIFWMDVERKKNGGLSFREDVIPVVNRYKGRIHTARPENLAAPITVGVPASGGSR
ncbi:MAG: hypothetical protein JXR37_01305 [Kiritimatiellae bacterium]|nr:hypothetical protein [Kiritimatiellia bacterium]